MVILLVVGVCGACNGGASTERVASQTGREPHESRIHAGGASLYARDVGRGQPIVVLHGGPDFDSGYLLPDLDRLANAFRLIYYDQRGCGKSAGNVRPEDVTLTSDLEDIGQSAAALSARIHGAARPLLGHGPCRRVRAP